MCQSGGADEKPTLAPLREEVEENGKEVRIPFKRYGDWDTEEDEEMSNPSKPRAAHFEKDYGDKEDEEAEDEQRMMQEETPTEAVENPDEVEAEVRIENEPEEFEK